MSKEKVVMASMFQVVKGKNPEDSEGLSLKLFNDDKVLWIHLHNGCIYPECGDGEGESEPLPLTLAHFDGSIEDMLVWFLDEDY